MQKGKVVEYHTLIEIMGQQKQLDSDYNDEKEELTYKYKEKNIKPLFGKNNELIQKELLKNKPTEDGGLVALSGFYFQMLVFIDYLVEMINGKWTFLALEYHDDVIAGNELDGLIRFIQVKTSKQATIKITDSSLHIYNRTISKQGKAKGKVRNNSWVDKLFNNVSFVKDLGVNTEFDIVSDYSIYSSPEVDINLYNSEKLRNKIIPSDDNLFTRMNKECFDINGELITYEENYGKSLNELLGDLCFVQKPKIKDYISVLCHDLSETLGEGIRITNKDLNWLVGELISKCAKRENSSILFLRREEVEGFRQALRKRAVDSARKTVYKTDAAELINTAMKSILSKLSDCEAKKELKVKMDEYKELLLKYIDENNTLQSLICRFNDGQKPLFGDNSTDYSEDLIAFLKTSIILSLIHEKFLISDKFHTLLIKEVKNKDDYSRIGFLNLGLELDYEEGLLHLQNIINSSTEEEQLEMLWRSTSLYTIFHGESVNLTDPVNVELKTSFKPKVERLDEDAYKSNDVSPVVNILPDKPISNLYSQLRKSTDYQDFKNKIEIQWNQLREVK